MRAVLVHVVLVVRQSDRETGRQTERETDSVFQQTGRQTVCSNRRKHKMCSHRETDSVFQKTYREAVLLVVLMQFPGHPQLSAQLGVHLHGAAQPARVHVGLPTQRHSYCPHSTTVTAHTTAQLLPTQLHSYCPHNSTVTATTTREPAG